jgi:hypothetical protein
MRETCARVLAAALMTGAVAFALAMPGLVDRAPDVSAPLTAPPSSLQRTVREATAVLSQSAHAERHAQENQLGPIVEATAVRSVSRRIAPPEPATPQPLTHGRTPGNHPATTKPAAPPLPPPPAAPASPAPSNPESRQLASTQAVPAQQAAPTPVVNEGKRHEKHHGRGKDGDTAHGDDDDSEVHAPTPAVTEAAPPATQPEDESCGDDEQHGHGHGKGHDKEHDD